MQHAIRHPHAQSTHGPLACIAAGQRIESNRVGHHAGSDPIQGARIEKDPLSIRVDQLLRILAALGAGVSIDTLDVQHSEGNNSGNNTGAW